MSYPEMYRPGVEALYAALAQARKVNLKPPPKLTGSQWSDTHARLSKETSSQTGRYTSYAYQRGLMDAVTDPRVTQISVMKSARTGYTRGVIDNAIGYYVHQDPCPILVVMPREDDAEDYSKTELDPMLRDTPVLAAIVGDVKQRDSNNTVLKKVFRNGASIKLIGANSPGGFRRVTIRVLLFDEVDGYPKAGAGDEGDQIKLGIKRTETFWNRKIIAGSTPTVKGESRIEQLFEAGDQRYFHVPCPHCGLFQVLEWGGKDTPHGIKWHKDEKGAPLPETAYYSCKNGCVIEEVDKPEMVEKGRWIASKPFKGHASFHIWTAYSLFPNAAWANIVSEFLESYKDPKLLQTFVNTTLGQPFEHLGEGALDALSLAKRREVYDAPVPHGVAYLFCGVDVQDYRVEMNVYGIGAMEEMWHIEKHVIDGAFDTPEVQNDLDEFLRRRWHRADGRPFAISATCVDSGGHHTQAVYNFSKARLARNVWAIKGEAAVGGKRSPIWPTKNPTSKTKATFRPIILGVNAAKDTIRSRLHIKQPGPGYIHFSVDCDLGFFEQLVSERSVLKTTNGQRYRVWELPSGKANEVLDTTVYAYAAFCGFAYKRKLNLNKRAAEINEPYDTTDLVDTPASEAAPAPMDVVRHHPQPAPPPPEPPKEPRILTAQSDQGKVKRVSIASKLAAAR